jgi:hypothetical protein
MGYFAPPTQLVLYSEFSPDECARRLHESIDVEQSVTFGFSGYRGTKPFVGEVAGKHFRVLQRVFSNRNSFPPVFVGELRPQGTGTRVVGAFDLELTSKIAACLFAIVGLFVLVLVVIFSYKSRPILSSVFACAYGGILLFFPRIFRRNGLSQEKCIADFLRETLVAEEERPHSVPGNDS